MPKQPTLADYFTPNTYRLTEAVTAELAAAGLVVHDDDFYDQLRVYRKDPPEAINRAALEALVREHALAYMDRLAEDPTERPGARRTAHDTAERIRAKLRGTVSYIRRLTDIVVDSLPEVTDDDIAPVRAALAAQKPPRKPRAPRNRAAYAAEYYAKQQAAAQARAAEVLAKWLDKHVQPGEYDARDLWALWNAQIMPRAAVKAPELRRVGRNAWYALLEATPAVTVRVVHDRRIALVH